MQDIDYRTDGSGLLCIHGELRVSNYTVHTGIPLKTDGIFLFSCIQRLLYRYAVIESD